MEEDLHIWNSHSIFIYYSLAGTVLCSFTLFMRGRWILMGEYNHYSMLQTMEALCDRNYSFLEDMSLLQYQRLINYILSPEKLNKGRVLTAWYFTYLLQNKLRNASSQDMVEYFNEKVGGTLSSSIFQSLP